MTIDELKIAIIDAVWGGHSVEEAIQTLKQIIEKYEKSKNK